MYDSISRKGVSAWLYNMGHEKLSEYVLDEKRFPSKDRTTGYIHINDIYQRIAGHSNYHGDAILAAFTCLTEGKEVKPVEPINIPEKPKGKWIKSYLTECCGTDENHNAVFRKVPCVKCDQCGEKRRYEEKFCPNCGAEMEV